MKLFKIALNIGVLSFLTACATLPQGPALHSEIRNHSKAEVADHITSLCTSYGFSVDATTDNRVECSRDGNTLDQLSFGSSHGSQVQYHLVFLIVSPRPKVISVSPQAYFEAQNAFGRADKIQQDPKTRQDAGKILGELNDWSEH